MALGPGGTWASLSVHNSITLIQPRPSPTCKYWYERKSHAQEEYPFIQGPLWVLPHRPPTLNVDNLYVGFEILELGLWKADSGNRTVVFCIELFDAGPQTVAVQVQKLQRGGGIFAPGIANWIFGFWILMSGL